VLVIGTPCVCLFVCLYCRGVFALGAVSFSSRSTSLRPVELLSDLSRFEIDSILSIYTRVQPSVYPSADRASASFSTIYFWSHNSQHVTFSYVSFSDNTSGFIQALTLFISTAIYIYRCLYISVYIGRYR